MHPNQLTASDAGMSHVLNPGAPEVDTAIQEEPALDTGIEEEPFITRHAPSAASEIVGDAPVAEAVAPEGVAVAAVPVEVPADAVPEVPAEVTASLELEFAAADLDPAPSLELDEADVEIEPLNAELPYNLNVNYDPKGRDVFREERRRTARVPQALGVPMPSITLPEVEQLVDRIKGDELEKLTRTPEGAEWVDRMDGERRHATVGGTWSKSFERPDSEWRQRVEFEGENYSIGRPRYGDDSVGGKLTGAAAIVRMQMATGMGALLRFPLWHTGIWVTLKAPSDLDLLELDRRITQAKITLGSSSYGIAFSNSSVIATEYLLDMILGLVYSTTAPSSDPDELRKLIDTRDLPTLIWGSLSTQYPDGYPYERGCITGLSKCNHVDRETLLLHKLSWTDNRRLSPAQKKHMSNRIGVRTMAELKAYQEGFAKVENNIRLNENVSVLLRSPTLAEYIESGNDWIDSIKDAVDSSFAGTMTPQDRDREILRRARASLANQYSHYIERVIIVNQRTGAQNFVEGHEDIREMLNVISGDAVAHETFLTAVGRYIDDSSVSILAIPRYNCPACNTDQGLVTGIDGVLFDPKRHPVLIPLDMFSLFFTITGLRITQVSPRTLPTG